MSFTFDQVHFERIRLWIFCPFVGLQTDFLPPVIQQMNGQKVTPHTLELPAILEKSLREIQKTPESPVAHVDGNCHSVTWQWVNFIQGMGGNQALVTLANGDALENFLGDHPQVASNQIRAGDVGFIVGQTGLYQTDKTLHSFIYLGFGLAFEKGNPGAEYPYRIAFLQDIIRKYKHEVPNSTVSFYRPQKHRTVVPELAHFLSIENSEHAKDLSKKVPQNILQAYLLQESFDKSEWKTVWTVGALAPITTLDRQSISQLIAIEHRPQAFVRSCRSTHRH